jgi:NADH-quinone oxidoreductase subunit E
MSEVNVTLLSSVTRDKIDQWLLRYPPEQKRSGVLEALRLVQEENGGWLTTPLMNAVADYLGMSHIAVYEVATFYSLFNLTPVGQHMIYVCTNISCMLSGAEKIMQHLKKRLGIHVNETTADGQFTLREVECLGACIGAPMLQIDKTYYENLTPDTVDAILAKLQTRLDSHGE